MSKSSIDRKRSRYGEFVTLRFHKPLKIYELSWNNKVPHLIARFTETDGGYAIRLWETLETLCFENYELKCALALDGIEYICAKGTRIEIQSYEKFEAENEVGDKSLCLLDI